jgi:hydroxymethylglutaryl-CoA lyase
MELPSQVKLVEVGPRDGLQNQPVTVSIAHRVELIERLAQCGFTAIETGSLVSPQRIPQMANSDIVYQQVHQQPKAEYIMLVANQQGLAKAISCQAKTIAVFCATTDAFSLNNINCPIDVSMASIQAIVNQAKEKNMAVRGYISCVLGCPFQGVVQIDKVCELAAKLYEYGCYEISLGDTIGVGTPRQVIELLSAVKKVIPTDTIAVHFHDTYGQALANIFAALQTGIHIIDSSVSGLGGCPFAPGASGNISSEDLVYMLNGLSIKTGVNLEGLIATSWFIADLLDRPPTAKVTLANAAKH